MVGKCFLPDMFASEVKKNIIKLICNTLVTLYVLKYHLLRQL